mmetsp:Transcript_82874/g.230186  ORF Transcript_82874/g.230186 Transcript_82874/m.230186 type:complete len:219 (-) Transcript_82874:846-1502(-)
MHSSGIAQYLRTRDSCHELTVMNSSIASNSQLLEDPPSLSLCHDQTFLQSLDKLCDGNGPVTVFVERTELLLQKCCLTGRWSTLREENKGSHSTSYCVFICEVPEAPQHFWLWQGACHGGAIESYPRQLHCLCSSRPLPRILGQESLHKILGCVANVLPCTPSQFLWPATCDLLHKMSLCGCLEREAATEERVADDPDRPKVAGLVVPFQGDHLRCRE